MTAGRATAPSGRGFGVYIHWPFCLAKCPYCDFNSHVRDEVAEPRWRAALLAELDHWADATAALDRTVTSIFFGGGTPSLMAPETVAALEYAAKLGKTFLPGTASWLDGHNNKAFLQGACSLTNNGISIYAAAQRNNQPEIADDMDHAYYPTGPVGVPTEFHVQFPMTVYNHTAYPNACKALLAWLMEAEQYNSFLQGSVGYLSHSLKAYDDHPVWTEDPKRTVFRDVVKRSRSFAHSGSLGNAASEVFADFVVVNMVAEAATGAKSPKQAAADAQRRAERVYRS